MGRTEEYLSDLQEFYPELSYNVENDEKIIFGRIRIIDSVGEEWGNYDIKVIIPPNYPDNLPKVLETSNKLKKDVDNHFFQDEERYCCLGWNTELHLILQNDYRISNFIKKAVIPFFGQQCFRDNEGEYINEITVHNPLGGIIFYKNYFNVKDDYTALQGLYQSCTKRLPNELCFCKKTKNKKCTLHSKQIENLKKYCKKNRLKIDFLLLTAKKMKNAII